MEKKNLNEDAVATSSGLMATIGGIAKGILAKIGEFFAAYGIKAAALTAGGLVAGYFLYKLIKKLKKGPNTEEAKKAYKELQKNEFANLDRGSFDTVAGDPYHAVLLAVGLRSRGRAVPEELYESIARDPNNSFIFAQMIKFKRIPEVIEKTILSSKYADDLPKSYSVESYNKRFERKLQVIFEDFVR